MHGDYSIPDISSEIARSMTVCRKDGDCLEFAKRGFDGIVGSNNNLAENESLVCNEDSGSYFESFWDINSINS